MEGDIPPHCLQPFVSAPSSESSSDTNRRSRRGRRLYTETPRSAAIYTLPTKLKSPTFWCTFCGKEFGRRYEWKRHEESVHVPQCMWVCPFVKRDMSLEYCPCCNIIQPKPDHLLNHASQLCENESVESRSFSRQDHLVQHMQLCHPNASGDTAGWRRQLGKRSRQALEPIPPNSKTLICGFCGYTSTWWEDRVEHVGNHFQAGADLTQWWLKRANNCREQESELWETTRDSLRDPDDRTLQFSGFVNKSTPPILKEEMNHYAREFHLEQFL
jgi:hypothetical protein